MSQGLEGSRAEELSPVKRALLEIRELRARLEAVERGRSEPIAIIGMACRFPGGVRGPDALWRFLCEGRDAITEVPRERWDIDAIYDPDPAAAGKMVTRWGGFVDDVADFDPLFFGISPREAAAMDPQQRLVLEVVWEALEHAGQAPDRLAGSQTGVFIGISGVDFAHLALSGPSTSFDSYLATGVVHAVASGRVAYHLGLRGPAISLDTACSSSLVAVHLAVQSLRNRECRMALVGGVNVILTPNVWVGMSRAGMMAADGRCKTFDARGDGYVRAEGCGVVVLKRLSDALADGDEIWAVIRGSAVNQDGRSSGLTAPNGPAQEAVIAAALKDAGVEPRLVGYVEAHGTGTALGDPIEVNALGAVLGAGRAPDQPVRLGSIKTNLGHLEAAAGVAGLMKAALALRYRQIPPHLHFQEPNPYIPWNELPVTVPTELTPFPEIEGRAIAGVSSFGFSGTNAHVVLEAPPAVERSEATPERPLQLLKLSAQRGAALDKLIDRYREHLANTTDSFADICYTAAVGRADLPYRAVVLAASGAGAASLLEAHRRGEEVSDVIRGHRTDPAAPKVAFLFTGHGAQYVNMGRELYETQPTFRAAIEECDAALRRFLDRSLIPLLYPPAGEPADEAWLAGMTYTQPALFAIEYALAKLWRSWGVEPAAVLGHSVGEYVAACVAGVLSLEDGLKLVAKRGALFDSLGDRGRMAAFFATEGTVRELVAPYEGEVSIAAVNGPTEIVVSGAAGAIEAILADAARRGIEFRSLAVGQAAHSPLLDPILDAFEATAATVDFSAPAVDLISCTTARALTAAEVRDPRYWRRHLRETVRFADALATLHGDGYRVFIEIGPHPVLCGLGGRAFPNSDALWLPSLRQGTGDWRQMLESVGRYYVNGGAVDWAGFERDYVIRDGRRTRRIVSLPTYPWEHQRFWPEWSGGVSDRGRAWVEGKAWEAAIEAGRHQQMQAPIDFDVGSFPELWQALDELTTAIVADTLGRIGGFAREGEAHTAETLVERLGILPKYRGIVARWLARLARAGLLREDGGRYVSTAKVDGSGLAAAWERARSVPGDTAVLLEYMGRCAEMLPRVLTGQLNALETMFPGGSTVTAEYLYRDWSLVRYYNNVVRAVVGELAREAGRPVRILEVGGGTGGTTAAVVPAVAGHAAVYEFTDVSELFLDRAAEAFRDHDFMRYGILDIDRDPTEQGYAAGSYDVVVGANVLHAARNLPQTLAGVRSLLAPGGVLVAFEVTRYRSWFDVTTSLLEGWENYSDSLRREHPLLTAEQWEAQLLEAGFERVVAFPEREDLASALGLHVIVARAPLDDRASPEAPRAQAVGVGAAERRVAAGASSRGEPDAAVEFARRVAAAAPQEREALLVEFVRDQIRKLLRLDPGEPIDRRRRLMELGLDSLMAVELRGRLSRGLALGEPLPATLVFDYPTIDAIVGLLEQRIVGPGAGADGARGDGAAGVGGEPGAAAIQDEEAGSAIDALSEEEAEARLLARLEALENLEP